MNNYCPWFVYLVAVAVAQGASLVVPNNMEAVYGNSSASVPFHMALGNSARYQQVYDASEFSSFGPGGGLITHLAFRVDNGSGASFDTIIPDIQINLSTTSRTPDGLSTVFAENIGLDNTIVYERGALSIGSSGPGNPAAWEVVIPLSTAFYYQPSAGNLLLDVRNFAGGMTSFFDGRELIGDSVSSVYAFTGDGSGSVGSLSGNRLTFGFANLIQFTPVPEPGTLGLLTGGLGLLGFVRWKRKRARQT